MVIVADDRAAIEADLPPGRLCCPHCQVGVFGGWGWARVREVRTRQGPPRLGPWRERKRLRTFEAIGVEAWPSCPVPIK
jgi:hypothetical protein